MAESLYILGDEDRKKFARLIAAAWSEDDVKTRYGREPRLLLAEYGIAYPEGVATPPLPPKPAGQFSIEELEVAAGTEAPADGCFGSASSVSCFTGCVATASTFGCAGVAET